MGLKIDLPHETSHLKLMGSLYFDPSGKNKFLFIPADKASKSIVPRGMKGLAMIYEITEEKKYRDLLFSLRAGLEQLFFNEENVLGPCVLDSKILPIYKKGDRMLFLFKRKDEKSYSVVSAKKTYCRELLEIAGCPYCIKLGSHHLDNQEILNPRKNLLAFPF
ncbi:MAG: hypothetical protein NT165_00925 [Candidatus Falkowbacteria bacterium]|nr:hypothetical protein [Candidatus Falkowbacteria bacterium]